MRGENDCAEGARDSKDGRGGVKAVGIPKESRR